MGIVPALFLIRLVLGFVTAPLYPACARHGELDTADHTPACRALSSRVRRRRCRLAGCLRLAYGSAGLARLVRRGRARALLQ